MDPSRRIAVVVGVLFIIATVASLAGEALIDPVLGGPHYLVNASAQANQVIAGVLLLFVVAGSVVLIPPMIYPFLKRESRPLALGYFGFRILEAGTSIVDALAALLLITLSRQYVSAGAPTGSDFQALGAVLVGARSWAFLMNPILFGAGSLMLNGVLYRARLVPRWLSVWGFIGAGLLLSSAVVGMFGSFVIALAIPIGVQEMVFAGWLIVKGFSSTSNPLDPAVPSMMAR